MMERTAPPEPKPRPEGSDRAARLAEALRANLARRKAQKRARSAGDEQKNKGKQ